MEGCIYRGCTYGGFTVYGVLPYIAPEVLNGEPYTIASDIYSFGVLMSVISTGQQPFYNISHDRNLAFKICEGVRPGFSMNTPKFYIELAYKCMDANPDNRPTAGEIYKTIRSWYDPSNHSLKEIMNLKRWTRSSLILRQL